MDFVCRHRGDKVYKEQGVSYQPASVKAFL